MRNCENMALSSKIRRTFGERRRSDSLIDSGESETLRMEWSEYK